ncbi:hypothetical protein JOB18_039186 [Solea senegalensis]|uniref:BHLH domain-containing protein n=1 Tax=Solea senegalensis TaxID=28829 RepID=A0AAV6Q7R8_SOLSE|nr:hypothetical protein JOB18_039186 [Solea senegalensis]
MRFESSGNQARCLNLPAYGGGGGGAALRAVSHVSICTASSDADTEARRGRRQMVDERKTRRRQNAGFRETRRCLIQKLGL